MNLLDFWQQDLLLTFNRQLEDADLGLTRDDSEFFYVDGEEGDYGIIRYKDATGQVVAIKTVEGGDIEDLELTEYGTPLVAGKLLQLFQRSLSEKLGFEAAADVPAKG